MALQITIIKAPGSVTVSQETHTFDGKSGTIGRGEDNQIVLEDPDRFLSSRHCEIICDGSHSYIVDLSTNGTFINGSPEPLGKGGKSALQNGDRFEVGDYVFEVGVAGEGVPGIQTGNVDAASPFDEMLEVSTSGPSASDSLDDLFAPEYSHANTDPFAFDNLRQPELSTPPTLDAADPLEALDRANTPAFPQAPVGETPSASAADEFGGPTYSDQAGALNQSITWPDSSRQNLIPEEWDDDLLSEPPSERGLEATASTSVSSPPPHTEQVPDTERVADSAAAVAEPVTAQPGPADPAGTAAVSSMKDMPKGSAGKRSSLADEEVSAGGATAVLQAMGLDVSGLSTAQVAEINDEVGRLMREVVSGMMQVLRSRSSIKNEFRMNVTTIQPVENNPLKFSADVDEALTNMFVRRTNAYKQSVEAVREGFQEIGEHQLAVIAGIRHGFERMMQRFNPEDLEKNFDKQGGNVLPGMKRARYWGSYQDYYKNLTNNMENSFQHLFGSDFVHAYEDQLRRLKVDRNKGN